MNALQVDEIAFHRNGICGVGFYAIRFRWRPDDADQPERFLAILFDDPGECAVIGIDRLDTQGVRFAGGNSWQGDHFEDELRTAIQQGSLSGGVRIDPFCLPTDECGE